jgi:hypothetical protein
MKMTVNCLCGGDSCFVEQDKMTNATFIECKDCGRMVGGLNKSEAIEFWNILMTFYKGGNWRK